MKKVLLLLAFVCLPLIAKTPLQFANDVEESMNGETASFPFVHKWAQTGMNHSMYIAIQELRRKGKTEFASELQSKWENVYHQDMFYSDRNIGDHAPVSQWIAEKYELIELYLGKDVCRALHISDIKSLNHGVPVTIHPGTFTMDSVQGEKVDEYVRHFAGGPSGDDYYYGVVPVCAYWAAFIGCQAAGGSMVCGLVGSLTERLIDVIAPCLGVKVFDKFAGKKE